MSRLLTVIALLRKSGRRRELRVKIAYACAVTENRLFELLESFGTRARGVRRDARPSHGATGRPVAGPDAAASPSGSSCSWPQMTLEEKVGPARQPLGRQRHAATGERRTPTPDDDAATSRRCRTSSPPSGTLSLEEASRHGLGHLTRVYGSVPVTAAEGAAELVRQQQVVLDGSRLGIPALVHEECLTGFTTYGATVYPAAIAWGATFDPDLVERMAAAIGRDMAARRRAPGPLAGARRRPRLPLGPGRGDHGRGPVPGGDARRRLRPRPAERRRHRHPQALRRVLRRPAAARNHGPVSMGRRELMDVILPPFETAVALAGAGSVMNSYSDVDGVPAGADPWLLTDLLRDEWGFTGTVVSDYWAVPFLATMHRVAADIDEAGAQALTAGIDVELPDTLGFGAGLVERVRRGELPEALVDRAARRLLTQKVAARPARPGLDAGGVGGRRGRRSTSTRRPTARSPARWPSGRSSCSTPARRCRCSARAGRRRAGSPSSGPCAADPRTFMGCYAFPNHVLPRYPGPRPRHRGADRGRRAARGAAGRRGRARAGLRGARRGPVRLRRGGRRGPGRGPVRGARRRPGRPVRPRHRPARAATPRTCGCPACRRTCSSELLDTGTPVVVVVVSGRPYALGDVHGRAAGLVQAFMPGEEGGAGDRRRPRPAGSSPAASCRCRSRGAPAASRAPTCSRRSAPRAPGSATSTRRRCSRSATARSYTTFEVDDLRISDARGADRRRVHA